MIRLARSAVWLGSLHEQSLACLRYFGLGERWMRMLLAAVPALLLLGGDCALGQDVGDRVRLPMPSRTGEMSVEEALERRRSTREFGTGALSLTAVSQLLWSAQGVTHGDGFRTAPSAGALYPLEVYLVSGDVVDLPDGVYRYRPDHHDLLRVQSGDARGELASAALRQVWLRDAPAVIVLAGVYERTTRRYGQRAPRYVHIEVGHAAQNVYLQAAALELASVFIGAFHDDEVRRVLGLPWDHAPLGLMPLGRTP